MPFFFLLYMSNHNSHISVSLNTERREGVMTTGVGGGLIGRAGTETQHARETWRMKKRRAQWGWAWSSRDLEGHTRGIWSYYECNKNPMKSLESHSGKNTRIRFGFWTPDHLTRQVALSQPLDLPSLRSLIYKRVKQIDSNVELGGIWEFFLSCFVF